MNDSLKVIFDMSVLGLGHTYQQAKTGIFRATEQVALGLVRSTDCDLILYPGTSLEQVIAGMQYVRTHAEFEPVSLLSADFCRFRQILNAHSGGNAQPFKTVLATPDLSIMLRSLRLRDRIRRQCVLSAERITTSLIRLLDSAIISRNPIFHSPFYGFPSDLQKHTHLKRFLTVYDLIPLISPHLFTDHQVQIVTRAINGLRPDDYVLCISNSTRNDLLNHVRIPPDHVFVTHLAASNDVFYPCTDAVALAAVRAKYGIPATVPYLLGVGTLEPRKNVHTVIRAFAELINQRHLKDLYLVLVGAKGWLYDDIYETIADHRNLTDRIIFTGFAADQDLAMLYSGAMAFAYLSLYEGFGLPPLEAMQCGTPVITSNTSSLPEIVSDAGIMVDPLDLHAVCQAVSTVYDDAHLRTSLSAKGIVRAQQFSWQKCVAQTITAYRMALTE